jgi:hypothetical protein
MLNLFVTSEDLRKQTKCKNTECSLHLPILNALRTLISHILVHLILFVNVVLGSFMLHQCEVETSF